MLVWHLFSDADEGDDLDDNAEDEGHVSCMKMLSIQITKVKKCAAETTAPQLETWTGLYWNCGRFVNDSLSAHEEKEERKCWVGEKS